MMWIAAAAAIASLLAGSAPHAETLKIASPQPGSWEAAIPVLGKQQGIFQKYDIDLDIVNTAGSGETIQAVISGGVDVGLSAGTSGVFGAFAKGAPLRIIGASETGSTDTYWYVTAKSPLQTLRNASAGTIAYSTTGASTHIGVLRFLSDLNLKAKPVSTGNPAATLTQVMSGQVDIGWAVAPFGLDQIEKGEIRLVGRASDVAAIREQTIRVQIANARLLAERKPLLERYAKAYREALDWMYASPDAIPRYLAYSHFSETAVRRMLAGFIPKQSLQPDAINGVAASMDDAVQFKFLAAPLTDAQVKELIQVAK